MATSGDVSSRRLHRVKKHRRGRPSRQDVNIRIVSRKNRVRLDNFRALFLSAINVKYLDPSRMNINTVKKWNRDDENSLVEIIFGKLIHWLVLVALVDQVY